MRYTLLVALIFTAIGCAQQTEVSKQSLHATISNLDTEQAPYNPDSSLAFAASPTPTLRSARLASAPGPTLGAIADFKEMYGLPVFGQGNLGEPLDVYPTYFGGERRSPGARRGAGSGHAGATRSAGAARAAGRSFR
ncbi:MAG: hypothetical protein WBE37_10750 [Bryobacteraceae bacterium]